MSAFLPPAARTATMAKALDALPAGLSAAARAVAPAIAEAAQRTGTDFNALFKVARVESGFRANARAATSSARGLFQFIDSTWMQIIGRHGASAGLGNLSRTEALKLRNDPAIASLMAAHHMADNAASLQQALGRAPDSTDLYLAHFLGLGGARQFLQTMAKDPQASGARLFPAAAKANPGIFYAGGQPRSLAGIHQLLQGRLDAGTPPPMPQPAIARDMAATTLADASLVDASLADTPLAGASLPQLLELMRGNADQNSSGATARAPAAARLAYLLLAELGG